MTEKKQESSTSKENENELQKNELTGKNSSQENPTTSPVTETPKPSPQTSESQGDQPQAQEKQPEKTVEIPQVKRNLDAQPKNKSATVPGDMPAQEKHDSIRSEFNAESADGMNPGIAAENKKEKTILPEVEKFDENATFTSPVLGSEKQYYVDIIEKQKRSIEQLREKYFDIEEKYETLRGSIAAPGQ